MSKSRVYVALDTETTGVGAESNDVIEIAAIKFSGDEVLDRWHSLVKPANPITFKVTQLTSITQRDVERAPLIHSLALPLLRFIGSAPIVGQSIEFDLQALAAGNIRPRVPAYDTFELATLLLPQLPFYNLAAIAAALGIAHPAAHRAMADAEVTMAVFRALLQRMDEISLAVLTEINRATSGLNWPLRSLFVEAEQEKMRNSFSLPNNSIREALLAKGVGETTLEMGLLQQPDVAPPLEATEYVEQVDADEIAALLAVDGPLARVNRDYEYRPQQVAMARAVVEAFNAGRHLLVEAGTGTGKSMAYLLPAIDFALKNGQRVVVSTNTINLQEQLHLKDLPALQSTLADYYTPVEVGAGGKRKRWQRAEPVAFRTGLVKGRTNYLCLRRWAGFRQAPNLTAEEIKVLIKGLIWLPTTATGDRAELLLLGQEQAAWQRVCATADSCDQDDCATQNGLCFLRRTYAHAEAAHIVVVNHALLLADLANGGSILPEYNHLIIDEAHNLEDQATEQLGYNVDERKITMHVDALARRNERGDEVHGLVASLRRVAKKLPQEQQEGAEVVFTRLQDDSFTVREMVDKLFGCLTHFINTHGPDHSGDTRLRLIPEVRHQPAWSEVESCWLPLHERLINIEDGLGRIKYLLEGSLERGRGGDLTANELKSLSAANRELRTRLDALITNGHPEEVYWLATTARNNEIVLHCAPLNVGDILRETLFEKRSVILASATLSTNDNFNYIRGRLGLDNPEARVDELIVGSPFDYQRAALLYLPTDMPEPGEQGYQKALEQSLLELCIATGGRAMVLFTSHSALKLTYKGLQRKLEAQGIMLLGHNIDGNRRQVLERFKANERAVLLGTASFWEGVDGVGDALSVLAIAKLPFAVPSDPIVASRSELFRDAFHEYSVPQAVLKLKQGFGRLIRSQTDRGVVAILDRRLTSKGYGATFLASLPPCHIERDRLAYLPTRAAAWLKGE